MNSNQHLDRRKFILKTIGLSTVAVGGLTLSKSAASSTTSANCEASVLDYGAIPNDNSTAAISANDDAFNLAIANNDAVFVPAGHYYLSSFSLSSKTRIYGNGTLISTDSSLNLVEVTAGSCEIDGLTLKNIDSTSARTSSWLDRKALIKVFANNCIIRHCILIDGPQSFIDFYSVSGGYAEDNQLIGGISSFDINTDTLYQGIRVTNSTDITISRNHFRVSSQGGMTGEAICLANSTSGIDRCTISENTVDDVFDHGVYAIGVKNCRISNNTIRANGSAIVCTSIHPDNGSYPNTISDNTCVAGTVLTSSTPGIFLRDASYQLADGNTIEDYPRGIQVSPVQYSGPTHKINGNRISNNIIRGWRREGIVVGKAGKQLGEMADNVISDNTIIWDSSSQNSIGSSISMHIGNEGSERIAISNHIKNNILKGAPDVGISVSGHDDLLISGNTISNPSSSGSGYYKTAIYIYDCQRFRIIENFIIQENIGDMRAGVTANSGVQRGEIRNNTVLGNNSSYPAFRRLQIDGDQNHLTGNRTGADSLDGLVTLSYGSSTVVQNDNINYARGYTTQVQLVPINSAAAKLIANNPVYVDPTNHLERVSFDVSVGAGGIASGQEKFFFQLIQ